MRFYLHKDVTKLLIKLRDKKIVGSDIYNICSNNPINLKKVIKLLSGNTPRVKIKKRGFQKADVYKTHGNNNKIKKKTKIKKFENFEFALNKTHQWFKSKYKIFRKFFLLISQIYLLTFEAKIFLGFYEPVMLFFEKCPHFLNTK